MPEWRANIAKTAVAADFLQATLTGRWLKAITIMGAAHILDRVIENRIGDDPEQREALDALTNDIGLLHALHYLQDLEDRRAAP